MPDNISIGIIVPNDFIKRLPFGGASGFILNIINALDNKIIIYGVGANGTPLWQKQKLNKNSYFSATYPILFPSRWPLRLIALIGYMRNRRRILNSEIDILYVHSPECALPFLFGKNRKPVVFHQHGSGNPVATATFPWARNFIFSWFFDKIHQLIYLRSDWIIVIDRLCRDQAFLKGAGDKLSLLMNAVDDKQFHPDAKIRKQMRLAQNLSEKETVVLFVGRLEEVKQVDLLIDALTKVDPKVQTRLFIAGDGSKGEGLKNLTVRLGMERQVVFLGKISHDQLPAYYNMADMLALPSKIEGVPMVILEALACGIPVIATAVGGVPDLVTTGKNGVLLNNSTGNEIATAINTVSRVSWVPENISETVSDCSSICAAGHLLKIFQNLMEGH